ncbi:MAG TPA: DUF2200 domain-containing protein [Nocardioides sp.]
MRIFRAPFASVHPLYVAKAERKGRTRAEVDEVIRWLTGFSQAELEQHLAEETTFEEFFGAARLNPAASLITGSVCGVRVQDVEDPLMQQIRWLDKLVDELARGKAMEKVLRRPEPTEPGSAAGSTSITTDRGPDFDGVRIGRPATGALIDAGHRTLADLPADLDELLTLHGVGPAAVKRLAAAR